MSEARPFGPADDLPFGGATVYQTKVGA